MENSPVPVSGKIQSQSRAVYGALSAVLPEVRTKGHPADRALAAHLRKHPEFGSRDRRLIGATVFSVFRWWGWLRKMVPGGEFPQVAETAGEKNADDWSKLLLGAWLAEPLDASREVAYIWAAEAGLQATVVDRLAALPSAEQRIGALLDETGTSSSMLTTEALLPDWIAAAVTCPEPFAELATWFQRRPPLWLRLQRGDAAAVTGELASAGLAVEASDRVQGALRVISGRVNFESLPAYREGRMEVQDLASQAVGVVCAPAQGERWWDACAGGGGKTLHMACLMQGKGEILATDSRESALEELRKRAKRAGFGNIRTSEWNGMGTDSARGRPSGVDGVLVDAPCTGSGTWRRNPDGRWRAKALDVERQAAIQQTLLRVAADAVKPGGVLVYATCSIFDRENEKVIASFLSARPDYRLDPFRHPLTDETTAGMARIWPWNGDCDAMFVARMKKRGSSVIEFPARLG